MYKKTLAVFSLALTLLAVSGCEKSASVEQSTNFSFQTSFSKANDSMDSSVGFESQRVELMAGQARVYGVFDNDGKEDVTVKHVNLSIKVYDDRKNVIWADIGEFDMQNTPLLVPAGKKVDYYLGLVNEACPSYDGNMNWSVDTEIEYDIKPSANKDNKGKGSK
jgi:hypothetical protein